MGPLWINLSQIFQIFQKYHFVNKKLDESRFYKFLNSNNHFYENVKIAAKLTIKKIGNLFVAFMQIFLEATIICISSSKKVNNKHVPPETSSNN